jgi:hypothetical protein
MHLSVSSNVEQMAEALLYAGPQNSFSKAQAMNPVIVSEVQSLCENGERERLVTLFAEYCEHFSCIPLCHSEVTDTQAINDLVRENVSDVCRLAASLAVPGSTRKTLLTAASNIPCYRLY